MSRKISRLSEKNLTMRRVVIYHPGRWLGAVAIEVRAGSSFGQATELLRFKLARQDGSETVTRDVVIGLSSASNHKFLPATFDSDFLDAGAESRFVLIFPGTSVPHDDAEFSFHFLAGEQKRELASDQVRSQRSAKRVLHFYIKGIPEESHGSDTLVVSTDDLKYLLPVVKKEEE